MLMVRLIRIGLVTSLQTVSLFLGLIVQPSGLFVFIDILIVIVISKLLERHSKAKRRAPAYSQALYQIRGVVQRIVRGRLRSGCQGERRQISLQTVMDSLSWTEWLLCVGGVLFRSYALT